MLFKHFNPSPLKNPSVSYLHDELESLNKLKIWLTDAWSISFNPLLESSAWLRSFYNKPAKVVLANLLMFDKLNKINFTERSWLRLPVRHFLKVRIGVPTWLEWLTTRRGLSRLLVLICSWYVNNYYDL
jgi:hypothetical protein